MIAFLRGEVLSATPGEVVLMVGGVGYRIHTKRAVIGIYDGASVALIIRQVVKEDSHDLYGFQFEAEEAMFIAITKIKGCGPKLAMTVLSGISTEDFAQAVRHRDAGALTAIKGVGAGTAAKIIEAFS